MSNPFLYFSPSFFPCATAPAIRIGAVGLKGGLRVARGPRGAWCARQLPCCVQQGIVVLVIVWFAQRGNDFMGLHGCLLPVCFFSWPTGYD